MKSFLCTNFLKKITHLRTGKSYASLHEKPKCLAEHKIQKKLHKVRRVLTRRFNRENYCDILIYFFKNPRGFFFHVTKKRMFFPNKLLHLFICGPLTWSRKHQMFWIDNLQVQEKRIMWRPISIFVRLTTTIITVVAGMCKTFIRYSLSFIRRIARSRNIIIHLVIVYISTLCFV